jgi:SAM-dependent methyltransferase
MNVEQSKYERLWRDHASYRAVAPGEHLADHFIALAHPQQHQTVIDFGCGTGRGALRIAQRTGATMRALDFVAGCMDPQVQASGLVQFEQRDLTQPLRFDRPADFGYCTDVLEHIPPEDVDAVLANIVSSARRVYLCISTVDDVMGALIGEPLHLTVRPAEWWREKLESLLQCRIYAEQVTDAAVIFWLSAWATFDDIEHRVELNVEQQRIRANIHANLDAGLTEVAPHAPQDGEVILLAGGPSLADHEDEIRAAHKRAGGTPIVTVNGAYNWAVERGFAPGLQVIVDAREFNRRFVDPVMPSCRYAVSSQCDPALVASLPRDQVLLWHGAGDEVHGWLREYDEARGQAREYFPVPGGSTVTLRALPLLAMLGFRRIGVYGFDSCLRGGAHHAYRQDENDGTPVVPIAVGGREFLCHGWMIKQAQEFQRVMQYVLIPAGVELAVHGDGLIAAIIEAAAAANLEH